jgi:hypothetical protein
MTAARSVPLLVLAAVLRVGAPLGAQNAPSPGSQPERKPAVDFSGILFGNYQYSTGPANANANAFNVDRAYLTFRIPAGERLSVRVTTDIFQDAGSNAYTVRAKYAYLQYDLPKLANGASILARAGILHTVEIEHEESFWPRYLTNSGVERAGFFSSADVGIASQLTLPGRLGEAYVAITNGPGYATRETDRFKDYQARLSLTPLMPLADAPALLRTLTLTAWTYRGALASAFASGGPGQVGPIGEALPRNRSGVLVGIKDPRLVVAAEWARATTGTESGENTVASPRARTDVESSLLYGFAVVRPLGFLDPARKSPFAIIARYDRYRPVDDTGDYSYHFLVAGISYDIGSKASLALDYQEQLPTRGAPVPALATNGAIAMPPPSLKTYFAHFVVSF